MIIDEPWLVVNCDVYVHEKSNESHDWMVNGSLLILASYVAFNAWFILQVMNQIKIGLMRSTHFSYLMALFIPLSSEERTATLSLMNKISRVGNLPQS